MSEDKQKICNLLCEALQATDNAADLVSITYIEDTQNTQHAKIQFMGGHRIVNVSMDSGTSMIRDIVNNLGT